MNTTFGLTEKTLEVINKHLSFNGAQFSDKVWEAIGKEIGWHPLTAALWYYKKQSNKTKPVTAEQMFNQEFACTCMDAYKSRQMEDPNCFYHQYKETVLHLMQGFAASVSQKEGRELYLPIKAKERLPKEGDLVFIKSHSSVDVGYYENGQFLRAHNHTIIGWDNIEWLEAITLSQTNPDASGSFGLDAAGNSNYDL